jgi:hypothetical protein
MKKTWTSAIMKSKLRSLSMYAKVAFAELVNYDAPANILLLLVYKAIEPIAHCILLLVPLLVLLPCPLHSASSLAGTTYAYRTR